MTLAEVPDPATVIVEHWMDTHPGEMDPSWPTVAKHTIEALEAAGYVVVDVESFAKMRDAYVLQEVRGGRFTEVPLDAE